MNRTEAALIARKAKADKTPPIDERFWNKVEKSGDDECWNWKASFRKHSEKYGAFWMNGRHHPSSRIAWILTNGEIPHGYVVCHKCDNPSCCNPSHLFIGLPSDNDADRVAKGRQCRGSAQKGAILNETIVLVIRAMSENIGMKKTAEITGIKYGTVRDVCARRSWRHV